MYKYIATFLIAMVPLIELRGAVPFGMSMGIDYQWALIISIIGNMVPVPFIYFFARKVLNWGAEKKWIGRFCRFCLRKGERAGQKLVSRTGKYGLMVALTLFVGIPIPGTGAWTGALGASFLDMGFKKTVLSVSVGVVLAGIIMAILTALGFHVFA